MMKAMYRRDDFVNKFDLEHACRRYIFNESKDYRVLKVKARRHQRRTMKMDIRKEMD